MMIVFGHSHRFGLFGLSDAGSAAAAAVDAMQ